MPAHKTWPVSRKAVDGHLRDNRISMIEIYLSKFEPIEQMQISSLWREMDRVWDELGLDNSRPLSVQEQQVAEFYTHPVWVLNGLFSKMDPVSRGHREAIAKAVRELGAEYVADYGGGSGVLAEFICNECKNTKVDIVEPYPFQFFRERVTKLERINYVSKLSQNYDLVVAQDVLEHVDDPIGLTISLIDSVRDDGYLIFANCFYPALKCHLPSSFYLRHQFKPLLRATGVESVGKVHGASHALIFKKRDEFNATRLKALARAGKRLAWATNFTDNLLSVIGAGAVKGANRTIV